MVDGLYVGFHITKFDLIAIGWWLGFGLGIGAMATFGVLNVMSYASKWIQCKWRARKSVRDGVKG